MDREAIMKIIPHRHEMLMLDGIIEWDPEKKFILGFRDVREGDYWTRGHFPGNPMLPGVLIVESAAQLMAILYKLAVPGVKDRVIAFGGIDQVRFRGVVRPGDRVILAGQGVAVGSRACRSMTWGWTDGKLVYEGFVLGVPIPGRPPES